MTAYDDIQLYIMNSDTIFKFFNLKSKESSSYLLLPIFSAHRLMIIMFNYLVFFLLTNRKHRLIILTENVT